MIGVAFFSMMLLAVPPPVADGFTYPGQWPEAGRYNRRWDEFMRRLPPPAPGGDPALSKVDWMPGAWTAQPRDFPSSMTDVRGAELSPSAAATIDWTAGHKWLHIRFVAQPWHAEWNYFLGHDPLSRRWVLHYVPGPSLLSSPAVASDWTGDRLEFRPTTEKYKGFTSIHRFVLVRTTADSFRIVSEIRMPSGKFVAMDDVLFTRRKP